MWKKKHHQCKLLKVMTTRASSVSIAGPENTTNAMQKVRTVQHWVKMRKDAATAYKNGGYE